MSSPLRNLLIAYDGITDDAATGALDTIGDVVNWYTCMAGSVVATTALSAKELRQSFSEAAGDHVRCLVVPIESERSGILPKAAWWFIKNPQPAPDPEALRIQVQDAVDRIEMSKEQRRAVRRVMNRYLADKKRKPPTD